MPVLVLNGGSSSLKYQLVEPISAEVTAGGLIERIDGTRAGYLAALHEVRERVAGTGQSQIAAVGHRVVHGGEHFRSPTLITPMVRRTIEELIPLAPLHNPVNAAIIDAAMETLPQVPHVAVFDTAFFAQLPEDATTYAIDRDVARANGIRRYGFHGISHEYVSRAAAELIGRPYREVNQIVLHLGNGASASAIERGCPIDTSMGLTPLEGLVMGTRGGDIDPGALVHLLRTAGFDADALDDLLSRRSGMKGLTGFADLRDVHAAAAGPEPEAGAAELGLRIYARRITKYIGAYLALLGRVDVITFTAGVGENDADIRERALASLAPLGVLLDATANRAPLGVPRLISAAGGGSRGGDGSRGGASAVQVAVIPTNEELAIARHVSELAGASR